MEPINIIKHSPLIRPIERPTRPINKLHAILLLIRPKLVIIHDTPAQRADDPDAVLEDGLEHRRQEGLVVQGALEIVALGGDRARILHEGVEAEFGDEDALGAEGVPDVAEVLAEVLRGDVGVGVGRVSVQPAVGLHVGQDHALRPVGRAGVGRARVDALGRGGGEALRVRVEREHVHGAVDVGKVCGTQGGEVDSRGAEDLRWIVRPEEQWVSLDAEDEILVPIRRSYVVGVGRVERHGETR